MAATHLDIGLRCIKYLLFAVNFLFVLTGAMIVSVGTTIYAVYDDFSHFLDSSYFSPATLLIVVGGFIFVIAFLGCCGALKESTCMVLVFAASLTFVLILEFAAAVAAYTQQEGIKSLLADKINTTMHEYESNAETKAALDFLQTRLRCCGYNSADDWNGILKNNQNGLDYPTSCCAWTNNPNSVYTTTVCAGNYKDGCIGRLSIIVNRSALYLSTGAMAIALIQLTGITLACMLGRAIRRQKVEKERRRWQLRESLLKGYQPLGKKDPISTYPVVYMQSSNCESKNPGIY